MVVTSLLVASPAVAGSWGSLADDIGKAAKGTGKAVSDTAGAVGEDVKGTGEALSGSETVAEKRREINAAERQALNKLFTRSPSAKKLYDISYGHAVFDTKKFSFMITTGFGAGVAVERASGKRTYMKMATGGVNVGAGGQYFKLVFLFENQRSFSNFVDKGWDATGQASAVGGKDALETEARFVEGMAIYQLTETGIMLAANIAGTKYWKDDKLN
jgi:lipid-binding SYLF domain-containing protein